MEKTENKWFSNSIITAILNVNISRKLKDVNS